MRLINSIMLCITVSTTLWLSACNGGSVPAPVATPTPTPTSLLQAYIGLLSYQVANNAFATDDNNPTQAQMSMNLNQRVQVNNITVNFYADNNCTTIAYSLPMDGLTTLNAGSYITTDASNLMLCSAFNLNGHTGCAYEFIDVNSMNFVINLANGQVNGSCMNNPGLVGERLGQYFTGTAYSRNCNQNYHCGFSQSYTIQIN